MKQLLAALLLCLPAVAHARVDFEFPAPADATARPNGVRTQAVPAIAGPGAVTTASRLWLKATNLGIMGNAFPAQSSDPSAQWPGSSGVEHLFYWGLWVGAAIPGAATPTERYRVTSSIEWRPPSLDPEDRIYSGRVRDPGTLRWVDDDRGGSVDEEFPTGRDDDGDGRIDEDTAIVADREFTFEMRDDTEQSLYANPTEQHRPLGLRVRQEVFAFEAKEASDFVATTYTITNVSALPLDSVFVGFLVDQDVGPVAQSGYWRDDLPEPLVPSASYQEILTPSDPRYDAHTDPNHPGGFCTRTSYRVQGFTMTDDDGDGGETEGASTFLLLDHTIDGLGARAPRTVGFRAYHLYRPGSSYVQGGVPTLDRERYEAMAVPSGVSGGAPALERPLDSQKDDWSTLCSVGPFAHLEPGQTVSVTVALGVWPIDYTQPARTPLDPDSPNPLRYQKVIDGAKNAFLFYRGRFDTPPAGIPTPPANGRETLVIAPPDRELNIEDCHFNPDSTGAAHQQPAGTAFWYNFGCDYCDAVKGKAAKRWVVPATPPGPTLKVEPGDHRVTLTWDNHSEVTPDRSQTGLDPNAGQFRFWGYRIYRAAGYTRPVGSTGPTDAQWELLADLRRYDAWEPLVDSLDTNDDGRPDAVQYVSNLLLDRETSFRHPNVDVPPEIDPATGDTLFARGVRTYFDRGCRCNKTLTNYKEPVYPVGRYRFEDRDVLNGFVYFYMVTAVDSSGAAGTDGTPGTLLLREGRRFAVEGDGVVPHASTGGAQGEGVIVVPNPYRGHAAWDLTPNPSDPTGAHVDFLHMPPGPWTLRIFTISGDLVTTIKSDDLQPNGRPQQEAPDDGLASWSMISRNGQDVVSGIYLFSVEAQGYATRGKFVVIR
jgi:hypothetical protein